MSRPCATIPPMEPSELFGIAFAAIALTIYVMNAAYAGIVADEKGLSNNAPIFLAMFAGPLVWLYLIARPVSVERAAERQHEIDLELAMLRGSADDAAPGDLVK